MDRRVVLAVVAAIAVLSAGIGWVAGQRIKSPAEIAAGQEPPPPSLITVPVERRTLSQNVVVRGTIRPSDETDLVVASAAGATVITRLDKEAGDLIEEGDVVVEVAGRPVIALRGELPAFRNLIPTLDGPDVRQLEQALVRLGYDPGPVDSSYSPKTGDAVAALYRDRGYTAQEADASVQGALAAAEATVNAQERAVTEAENALAEAQVPASATERRRLDLVVSQAEVALDASRAAADEANAAAQAAVTGAEQAQADAASTASSAAMRLEQARTGNHPDTGQPPTADQLAELEAAAAEARTTLADADAALASARSAMTRTANEQSVEVASAEIAVDEAKEARTNRLDPSDVANLRGQVSDAEAALGEARAELTEARARVGAWVPTTEVVFLSTMPRQVATVFGEVGDAPTGPVMTISGAETVIESGVSTADRRLIEVGAEALLEDDDLGISIEAIVTLVADNPGGAGLSEDRFALRLEPVSEVPEDAVGVNLRISIPITSSGGDVLAVPLAALSAGPDGTARVEVERVAGQTEVVEVSTGLRAEGFVEIEPLESLLDEGDRVVVGRDLDLPGTDPSDGRPDGASPSEDGEPS